MKTGSYICATLILTAAFAFGQTVTSARSGTLHYFQGDISLNGEPLQWKVSKFPEVRDGMVLRSGLGRAEVLLTPGVFLRMGENSAIKMLDTRLAATRVELLSGTIAVESEDPRMSVKSAPVTLISGDREIRLSKNGFLELSADPAELRVFKGESIVAAAGQNISVRDGHVLAFTDTLTVAKFDTRSADDLYLWARDRSQQLSAASMSTARSLDDSKGGWHYNSGLNMYTLVTAGGTSWSPFGYGFYSPGSVGDYYSPVAYWYGGATRGASAGGQALSAQGHPTTTLFSPVAAFRTSQSDFPTRGGSGGGFTGGFGGGGGGGASAAAAPTAPPVISHGPRGR